MRDYAKLGPTFWTGETGRALRRRGSKALLVAAYLISSPHSNMLGLYYQPVLYMAHETGLGIEGATEGLQACIACGFCSYDEATEMVWVHEMAAWQIAPSLSSGDKRCKGIQKDYDALSDNPFLGAWFDRYCEAFHLSRKREWQEPEPKGHSKPLRSQEQEQEQEQEQDPLTGGAKEAPSRSLPEVEAGTEKPAKPQKPDRPEDVDPQTWADWLALRKAKKAPVTATVLAGAVAEAAKAGMPLDAFLRVWCTRGTQGLQADWLKPHERPAVNGHPAEPAWRTEQRERTAAFAGRYAEKPRGTTTPIPQEGSDAPEVLG